MMGYMRHHVIIVTGYKRERAGKYLVPIEDAYKKAQDIFEWISPMSPPMTNGYCSFFIPPDGSKEGWGESDKGDMERAQFVEWLKAQSFEDGSSSLDWAEVQYADDSHESKILSDSQDTLRERGGQVMSRCDRCDGPLKMGDGPEFSLMLGNKELCFACAFPGQKAKKAAMDIDKLKRGGEKG